MAGGRGSAVKQTRGGEERGGGGGHLAVNMDTVRSLASFPIVADVGKQIIGALVGFFLQSCRPRIVEGQLRTLFVPFKDKQGHA